MAESQWLNREFNYGLSVQLLVAAGSDVNAADSQGSTPLQVGKGARGLGWVRGIIFLGCRCAGNASWGVWVVCGVPTCPGPTARHCALPRCAGLCRLIYRLRCSLAQPSYAKAKSTAAVVSAGFICACVNKCMHCPHCCRSQRRIWTCLRCSCCCGRRLTWQLLVSTAAGSSGRSSYTQSHTKHVHCGTCPEKYVSHVPLLLPQLLLLFDTTGIVC
jgi:hypothetical protein